jgi:hypothetical protein
MGCYAKGPREEKFMKLAMKPGNKVNQQIHNPGGVKDIGRFDRTVNSEIWYLVKFIRLNDKSLTNLRIRRGTFNTIRHLVKANELDARTRTFYLFQNM